MMNSFLDNDYYKFLMGNAIFRCYQNHKVRYDFTDREQTRIYRDKQFLSMFENSLNDLCSKRLTYSEYDYLKSLGVFSEDYLQYLKSYKFNKSELEYGINPLNRQFHLSINGDWLDTILWEVPLLAIISEIYSMMFGSNYSYHFRSSTQEQELHKANIKFAEFGTRRRHSYSAQDWAVGCFKSAGLKFLGTSNLDLAKKFGVKPIGTIAHEWFMAHEALYGIVSANNMALHIWNEIYRDSYKVILPDTFTTNYFMSNVHKVYLEDFNGFRQDSGDPVLFAGKIIGLYATHGIDPKTKDLIFSDGLTVDKAIEIEEAVGQHINTSYAIGTHFTNNQSYKLVIKMSKFNDKSTVKISDDPGKATGDPVKIQQIKGLI